MEFNFFRLRWKNLPPHVIEIGRGSLTEWLILAIRRTVLVEIYFLKFHLGAFGFDGWILSRPQTSGCSFKRRKRRTASIVLAEAFPCSRVGPEFLKASCAHLPAPWFNELVESETEHALSLTQHNQLLEYLWGSTLRLKERFINIYRAALQLPPL